ncbi:unnamed protein product, partial [Mesorhabditis spiculigera]
MDKIFELINGGPGGCNFPMLLVRQACCLIADVISFQQWDSQKFRDLFTASDKPYFDGSHLILFCAMAWNCAVFHYILSFGYCSLEIRGQWRVIPRGYIVRKYPFANFSVYCMTFGSLALTFGLLGRMKTLLRKPENAAGDTSELWGCIEADSFVSSCILFYLVMTTIYAFVSCLINGPARAFTKVKLPTETLDEEKSFSECEICYQRAANCRIDCGHHICCCCLKSMTKAYFVEFKCPFCREQINGAVKIIGNKNQALSDPDATTKCKCSRTYKFPKNFPEEVIV